jgi:hypothetical protein
VKTQSKPLRSILAPISLGELIDKITILQIKTRHLRGSALKNASKELNALLDTLEKSGVNIEQSIINALERVNSELWEIEDNIRQKEHENDFSTDFVRLARSVYQKNDLRSTIKREINITYGSEFIEEKAYKNYRTLDQ